MFAVAHYPRKQRRYCEICVGFSDLVRLKRDEAITNGHCKVGESQSRVYLNPQGLEKSTHLAPHVSAALGVVVNADQIQQ